MSTVSTQNTVTSQDGTIIAYSQVGQGPALILVDGALCYRQFGPAQGLAEKLAPHFTVITYDRRGRGESGDTQPYAVEREIEDLAALVEAVGGTAYVSGQSSGAGLAIAAANQLPGITKLALYEAPFVVDDARKPITYEFLAHLKEAVAQNRRSQAVKMFMRQVGTPGFMVAIMPLFPMWSKLTAVAHTLPYDISTVVAYGAGKPLPTTLGSAIKAPTLVMDGGKSPTWMRHAMQALAQTLPNADYRTLAGQTHMVKPESLVPVLEEFFAGEKVLSTLQTDEEQTPEQKAGSGLVPGFFDNHGWGLGVSVITRRDDIAAVPGRYGWDGGLGTSWYSDPREEMVIVLMTRCAFGPSSPPNVDFWTLAYQAIED